MLAFVVTAAKSAAGLGRKKSLLAPLAPLLLTDAVIGDLHSEQGLTLQSLLIRLKKVHSKFIYFLYM